MTVKVICSTRSVMFVFFLIVNNYVKTITFVTSKFDELQVIPIAVNWLIFSTYHLRVIMSLILIILNIISVIFLRGLKSYYCCVIIIHKVSEFQVFYRFIVFVIFYKIYQSVIELSTTHGKSSYVYKYSTC